MNTAISSRDERAFSAPALLVAGAFFMEFLDGTVIATALPDMARDFGVTAVELNIGISAYLITLAVLIPASGWIADRFGARPWRTTTRVHVRSRSSSHWSMTWPNGTRSRL